MESKITDGTLSIIKARLPEVILIVGLYFLGVLSMARLQFERSQPFLLMFFMIFFFIVMIFSSVLSYGFLRMVFLEGAKPQQPQILLRAGKPFFWRMAVFGLIYSMVFLSLLLIMTIFFKGMFFSEENYRIVQIFQIFFMIILVKPVVFIPAIMIVLNSRLFESFGYLKFCRIFKAKEVIVFFAIQIIILSVSILLKAENTDFINFSYILWLVNVTLTYFFGFLIGISAVRFIASLYLVYEQEKL